jgi:hypothetical protein
MTRRLFSVGFLFLALLVSVPAAARPTEKAGPLDVTYYYLPG